MTPDELQGMLKVLREADQQWRAPDRLEESIRRAASEEILRETTLRAPFARGLAWAAGISIALGTAVVLYVSRAPEPPGPVSAITYNGAVATQLPVLASYELIMHPLPDAAPIGRVRIRVPRSALIAFGVAAAEPLAPGFVEADVELGPDGHAQRVRFFAEPAASGRN